MTETQFTRFSFQPFIIEAIKTLRFYKPTEIQERIIPGGAARRKHGRPIANRNGKNTCVLIADH